MTDEQKAALADLDRHIECGYPMSIASARTLKAMLAEPRLPAPSAAIAEVLFEGYAQGSSENNWLDAYRALYAHLTAPKTKTEWWVHCCEEGTYHRDLVDAMRRAEFHARKGRAVTIEQREVPA